SAARSGETDFPSAGRHDPRCRNDPAGLSARLVNAHGAGPCGGSAVGECGFAARRALRRGQWVYPARNHQFHRHGLRQLFRAGLGVRRAAPLNLDMLRITELRLPLDHDDAALRAALVERLRVSGARVVAFTGFRGAVDARRKSAPVLSYTIDCEVIDEAYVLAQAGGAQ